MKTYLQKLVSFSVMVFTISFLLFMIPELMFLKKFTWASIAFFTLLSGIIYFLGTIGVSGKSNYAFITYIYVSMGIKMMLCVVMVFSYLFFFKPEKIFFIIPFFLLYILYTVFETFFLVKESQKFKMKKD